MNIKTYITILLFSCLVTAQTVYEVTPGTKGNEIILSIENESGSTDAEELEIKTAKFPEQIKLIRFCLLLALMVLL
jgi:hypothetical protein